jgi:orotate phosphoribosyltransferase
MLKASGALTFGDFTLASGKQSPYYVDIKRAITRPDVLRSIARAMAPLVRTADRIAGVELGAVPIAAAVAMETGKPYIIVRKERKEHGTSKDFEGDLKTGETVVFVEDVVTTGGTLAKAIERLRGHGATVTEAIAIVDREEGGREALASIRVTLRALLTADELLAASKP